MEECVYVCVRDEKALTKTFWRTMIEPDLFRDVMWRMNVILRLARKGKCTSLRKCVRSEFHHIHRKLSRSYEYLCYSLCVCVCMLREHVISFILIVRIYICVVQLSVHTTHS